MLPQASLQCVTILLFQFPEFWDYRYVLTNVAINSFILLHSFR